MGTTRSFSSMLNDNVSEKFLYENFTVQDYLLSNIEKDETWIGASSTSNEAAYIVPFEGAMASSFSYGALTADTDIAEYVTVRGRVTTQPELWGTLIFNHRDLLEHGKVSQDNFLKILPDQLDRFMEKMKSVVSVNLLNGAQFSIVPAGSVSASGILLVSRVERFELNQKVIVEATSPSTLTGYVSAIDRNTGSVTLVTARGGATPLDFNANNVPTNGKCWYPGGNTAPFSSLRGGLLSAANGGDTTLYGVTKTAYPFTQAVNINGANVTAANILSKIFAGYTVTRRIGKGTPTSILMSQGLFGFCMAVVEASKGAYNVVAGSRKASQYGWDEITLGSVTGQTLKLVGVNELDDDIIIYLDWKAILFASNGMFRIHESPDGVKYFVKRNTTGYQYIVDICLFGDLIIRRPSYCGIMYNIAVSVPYAQTAV